MSGAPSFSIVMPTYQRRDVVCDAVRAIGSIRYEGQVEIIVVVDGSTDGTAEALEGLKCPFPLRVIDQPNRGQANARNHGARRASGDIILFLDDDMMAEPDILDEHARTYEAGADAVVGDFPVDPRSSPGFLTDSIATARRWERSAGDIRDPFELFVGHLSVRRSVFETLGGFDEQFTRGGSYGNEDIDFGRRLLKSFRVCRNPRAIARQRHIVSARQHMRRASEVARADMHFASKHPDLAEQLFERRGRGGISATLRLLSATPLISRILAPAVVGLSELALRSPFRSSRKLAHLFTATYLVSYWSAMRKLQRQAGVRRNG